MLAVPGSMPSTSMRGSFSARGPDACPAGCGRPGWRAPQCGRSVVVGGQRATSGRFCCSRHVRPTATASRGDGTRGSRRGPRAAGCAAARPDAPARLLRRRPARRGRRTPTLAPTTPWSTARARRSRACRRCVARDGTGVLVYLRNDAGAAHVFVSACCATGSSSRPARRRRLTAPSRQPVVAPTNNGLTQIAFVNGGTCTRWAAQPLQRPVGAVSRWLPGRRNPSLSMSTSARPTCLHPRPAPAATTSASPHCRPAAWSLAPSVLDANPADDAGAGTARP